MVLIEVMFTYETGLFGNESLCLCVCLYMVYAHVRLVILAIIFFETLCVVV